MGDEPRRERRQFEPPPWERDVFEALAAKRAQEQDDSQIAAAQQQEVPAVPEASIGAESEPGVAAGTEPAVGEDAGATAAPDEKTLQVMLLQLAQHERQDDTNTRVIGWVASGLTAAFGLSMVVFGLVLAVQAHGKSTVMMGSAVLTVFGLVFAAMAAWVWVSSNRVRGR